MPYTLSSTRCALNSNPLDYRPTSLQVKLTAQVMVPKHTSSLFRAPAHALSGPVTMSLSLFPPAPCALCALCSSSLLLHLLPCHMQHIWDMFAGEVAPTKSKLLNENLSVRVSGCEEQGGWASRWWWWWWWCGGSLEE